MKLTANRKELLAALAYIAPATKSKSPKARHLVMTAARLPTRAGAETLTINASRGDLAANYVCAQVQREDASEWSTAVAMDDISKILRGLESEFVTMTIDKARMIVAGESRFTIATQDPKIFPPPTVYDEAVAVDLPGLAFGAALRNTVTACEEGSSIPQRTTVCLYAAKGEKRIKLAATDSRRLALDGFDLDAPLAADLQFMLPVNAARSMLIPLAASLDKDGRISARFGESSGMFAAEDRSFVTAAVAAKPYPYESILRQEAGIAVKARVADMLPALRHAHLFATGESKGAMLSIGRTGIDISAVTTNAEVETRIPCESTGELVIGMRPDQLDAAIASLDAASDAQLHMDFTRDDQPVIMTYAGRPHWRYVIMPLHLNKMPGGAK